MSIISLHYPGETCDFGAKSGKKYLKILYITSTKKKKYILFTRNDRHSSLNTKPISLKVCLHALLILLRLHTFKGTSASFIYYSFLDRFTFIQYLSKISYSHEMQLVISKQSFVEVRKYFICNNCMNICFLKYEYFVFALL